MEPQKYRPPYAEDYFSDDGHGQGVSLAESFTPDPSPGRANVRTKRSDPEDMGTEKTPTGRDPKNSDVKSDSGYSSQSVAGMSSADSAASATSQRSPPVANTIPAAPSPTPAQRVPRPSHHRQQSSHSAHSSQNAPRQPLQRRDSQASRRPPPERRPTNTTQPAPKRRDSRNVDDPCTQPGCTTCGPDAVDARPRQLRRQSMQPTESAPNVSYSHPQLDIRSQVSDPAPYPPSPRDSRPPQRYHAQGGPVIQPAMTPMPRRPSVTSRSARPTSYHGDPKYNWPQAGMHSSHPSPPHEHGPPPSRSAYGNMPYGQPQVHSPYMPPYPPQAPPPAAFYQAQQMHPTYDQRPLPQARVSTSGYGYSMTPPLVQVERSDRNMPSARGYHSNAAPPPLAVQRQPPRLEHRKQEYNNFQSESESESDYEEEPEYQSRPTRRPSLRHANTTPAAPPAPRPRPQTVVIPEPLRDSRVRDRNHDVRSTRRTSKSRPLLVPSIKSQSAYDTPQARMIVEGSRSSRRESLLAHDMPVKEPRRARQQEYNELRRTHRSSKIYNNAVVGHDYERERYDDDDDDDDEEEEAEPVARRPLRRRDTDTESRRRSHRPVEAKQAAVAEDYINSRRGERETVADHSYAVANKRSSRVSGGPSEAESSRSSRSDNNGDIRLRIGNNAPVVLSLNGDMEGRTLQLLPSENGMNELVISSSARGESIYRSEGGSVRGERRAITSASQARKDAEELTERSSQSSRRRRETRTEHDEPRHVLQRRGKERREPQYH